MILAKKRLECVVVQVSYLFFSPSSGDALHCVFSKCFSRTSVMPEREPFFLAIYDLLNHVDVSFEFHKGIS